MKHHNRAILAVVALVAVSVALFAAVTARANPNPQATAAVKCDFDAGTASASGTTAGFAPKQHNLSAKLTLTINGNVADSETVGPYSGPGTSLSLSAPLPNGAGPFEVTATTEAFGGTGALMASDTATVTCEGEKPPPPPPPCEEGEDCGPPPPPVVCETCKPPDGGELPRTY